MRTFSDPKKQTLYRAWVDMRSRCHTPSCREYLRYGGRGITHCRAWDDFDYFYLDMEATWAPGLSLGRRDNDGNYTPENCRWETPLQQSRNRSTVKLDEAKVAIIRQRLAAFERPGVIAQDFGVTRQVVSDIKHGRTWNDSNT